MLLPLPALLLPLRAVPLHLVALALVLVLLPLLPELQILLAAELLPALLLLPALPSLQPAALQLLAAQPGCQQLPWRGAGAGCRWR